MQARMLTGLLQCDGCLTLMAVPQKNTRQRSQPLNLADMVAGRDSQRPALFFRICIDHTLLTT